MNSLNDIKIPAPPMATPIQAGTKKKPDPGDQPSEVMNYAVKDAVLRSEILWTLKLITTHQSYKSSENTHKLFYMYTWSADLYTAMYM